MNRSDRTGDSVICDIAGYPAENYTHTTELRPQAPSSALVTLGQDMRVTAKKRATRMAFGRIVALIRHSGHGLFSTTSRTKALSPPSSRAYDPY